MSSQPTALAEFQRQRTVAHRDAVLQAIRHLNASGEPINVSAVAARAGVDRSYIYDHPDLLDEIRQRRHSDPRPAAQRPLAVRASQTSLHARLAAAHAELARLRAENGELRRRLEDTLGSDWGSV